MKGKEKSIQLGFFIIFTYIAYEDIAMQTTNSRDHFFSLLSPLPSTLYPPPFWGINDRIVRFRAVYCAETKLSQYLHTSSTRLTYVLGESFLFSTLCPPFWGINGRIVRFRAVYRTETKLSQYLHTSSRRLTYVLGESLFFFILKLKSLYYA